MNDYLLEREIDQNKDFKKLELWREYDKDLFIRYYEEIMDTWKGKGSYDFVHSLECEFSTTYESLVDTKTYNEKIQQFKADNDISKIIRK